MAVSISLSITQNSQSIPNNTSNVTVAATVKWTYGSWNATGECYGSITIDGTKYSFSGIKFNTGATTSGSQVVMSKTVNVSHAADGKKTLSCSTSFYTGVSPSTVSASASKALTTIPRKSTLSVADGTLGTAQTLTVSQQATSFTHSIKADCGDSSYYIKADGSTSTSEVKYNNLSISFTPPIGWASQNTSGTSVSVTYTITTYNGSTSIGDNSYTKTCTMPASVKPSCTLTVTDPTGYKSTYGGYVKGRSKFKVVINPTTSYGSAIKSYGGSVNGQTITAATTTTGEIKSSGSLTITGSVTDNRGRSGSASTTATVLDYSAATITAFGVKRCDSDGTENMQGGYVQITFSSSVTSLSNKNTAAYVVRYKKKTDSTYTSATLSNYANNYAVSNGTYRFAADTGASYNVELTVTDAFDSETKATSASTAFAIMHWRNEGDGIAFGKVAERGGMEIGMDAFMNNSKALYCGGTDGLWYNVLGSNSSDTFHFGYGGYNNDFGTTYYNGNKVNIRSKTGVTVAAGGDTVISGGNTEIQDGHLLLENGKAIQGYNASGTARTLLHLNSSNNTLVGYGGYSASEGATYIYGNNVGVNTKGWFYVNSEPVVQMKKVWANASPTSSFGAQTVTCATGDYNDYLVQFGYKKAPMTLAFITKGVKTVVYGVVSYPAQRTITINANNFVVTVAELLNNGWTTNNDVMIPLAIYGIEGVS